MERFPFLSLDVDFEKLSFAPLIPITLVGNRSVLANGLIDTAINVLPFSLGLQMGVVWEKLSVDVPMTGILAGVPARGIVLEGQVGQMPPARLAFAWVNSDAVPLILGRMNFLPEFDVCIYGFQSSFEIRRRP